MPSFKAFAEFQKKVQEQVPPKSGAPSVDKPPEPPPPKAGEAPAANAPTEEVPKEALKIGMKVKVTGLQARPELNNLVGVLTSFDEQRSRWMVELVNGGGAKLFKGANLEQFIDDADALDILKGRAKGPPAKAKPSAVQPKAQGVESASGEAKKGAAEVKAGGAPRSGGPDEEEDDEAFVRSIEQCLKECDVMWDDY